MHSHSETATKMLEKMVVGYIKTGLDKMIFRGVRKQTYGETEVWRLVGKKTVAGDVAVLQFRSPNFKVVGVLPGTEHCGRYFTVVVLVITVDLLGAA